jgi:hypothetical protein
MPVSSVVPPGFLDVKGCKEKLCCEIWDLTAVLLGCYAVLLGLLFVTFQRNVIAPLSGSRSLRNLARLLDPVCEFCVIIQSIRCWALNDRKSLFRCPEFLIVCCVSCKKLPSQISIIYHVFWQQYYCTYFISKIVGQLSWRFVPANMSPGP